MDAAASGIAEWERTGEGATYPALEWAKLAADGWELDRVSLIECAEAHALLDSAGADLSATALRVCRNLWGGPTAPGFATEALAADVAPVAAALMTPLGRLNRRAAAINDRLHAEIIGALISATATATRGVGARLAAAAGRAPAAVAAELGGRNGDLEVVRQAMADAAPFGTWFVCPDAVLAVLDVDTDAAISQSGRDLEETIAALALAAQLDLAAEVAGYTGEPAPAEPTQEQRSAAEQAGQVAGMLLLWWVTRKVLTRTGDPSTPESALARLTQSPAVIAAPILAIAGGAKVADPTSGPATAVARNRAGQPVDVRGRPTGGTLQGSTFADIAERPPAPAGAPAGSGPGGTAAPAVPALTIEYTWDYGNPGSRFKPYPPHQALDGRVWRMGDNDAEFLIEPGRVAGQQAALAPSIDGYFVGDHDGCQCNIRIELVEV